MLLLLIQAASCGGGNDNNFESEIAQYEQEDILNYPPEKGVVVIGSSSIRLWSDIQKDLQPVTIISRGFGGSTMYDALYYLDRIVIPYNPRAVVIYEGDNDIANGVSPEIIVDDFINIINSLKTHNSEIRIYYISIKPSLLRWALWDAMEQTNTLIKAIAEKDTSVYYIDIATAMFTDRFLPDTNLFRNDLLHLNTAGYALWTDIIQNEMVTQEKYYE